MSNNYYDIESFRHNYLSWRENENSANELVEKPNFLKLLPDVKNKRVLDLGCGFGTFTRLIYDAGASKVTGIDASNRMIELAKENKCERDISFEVIPLEEMDFPEDAFDIVVSNLVLHYIEDISSLFCKIHKVLSKDGYLIFSTEHPTSTASYNLGWYTDEKTGELLYWKLDNYGVLGERQTNWMEHIITKYHRTIEAYCKALLENGFSLEYICEAVPTQEDIKRNKDLKKYLKRPLYLIIKAKKQG